jgi:hypothetical protein
MDIPIWVSLLEEVVSLELGHLYLLSLIHVLEELHHRLSVEGRLLYLDSIHSERRGRGDALAR